MTSVNLMDSTEVSKEVPLLQALKTYGANFMITDALSLPSDTPFGNLSLTYHEIMVRLECLNELIGSLYTGFYNHQALLKSRGGWSTSSESFKHRFEIEQVIYWLRKTADEFISILYVLKYFKEHDNTYPDQIQIASIGKLLKTHEILDERLLKHLKLLNIVNEISNGYKHTLINAQTHSYRGANEPVVFALYAHNDVKSIPRYHQRSLRAILESYNKFLIDVKLILESKYQVSKPKAL